MPLAASYDNTIQASHKQLNPAVILSEVFELVIIGNFADVIFLASEDMNLMIDCLLVFYKKQAPDWKASGRLVETLKQKELGFARYEQLIDLVPSPYLVDGATYSVSS